MLDRTIQPRICEPEQLAVPSPECRVMKNGIPLYILNAGDNEVVRIDLLIEGGLSGPSHFDKCRIWRYASVRAISAEGRLSFD